MRELIHRTAQTGHERLSPRSEVADDIVDMLRPIVQAGGGALGPTGLRLANLAATPDGWRFSLTDRAHQPLVECELTVVAAPILVVALRDAALLLDADSLMALADCERCIAWAILEGQ